MIPENESIVADSKDGGREAGYRIALMRIIKAASGQNLRAAYGETGKEPSTADLETCVREIARIAPAVVQRGVEKILKKAQSDEDRAGNLRWSVEQVKAHSDSLRERATRILKLCGEKAG
ncbi:MAG TPA: hypothetical protein VIK53_12995 [Verrucomicrobiae bacterium]